MRTPIIFINPTTLLIYLLTSTISYITSAQTHTTLVAPLNKDTKTSLYTIALDSNERHVIDLSSSFSWRRCPSIRHPTVACFTTECIQATYLLTPDCTLSQTTPSKTPCICMITPLNPITKTCASSQLTSTNLTISYTKNGANPTAKIDINNFYFSCAPSSLFRSLPRGALGLSSLSLAPLSLPSQFSSQSFGVTRKFGICLPSTNSINGVIFFGDGPYNLLPTTNFDVTSLLSYTTLLRNPKTADYFIGIKALSINSNYSIAMSPNEGIKLSTVVPYTTMRTDIFKQFVAFFTKAMKGIQVKKKVVPFSACYNASEIGYSRVGLHVPRIDLEFDNGKSWTIYGANSMKQVGGDIACLAFLDGGESPEHSIVIGSFQMEENFLLFDLDQSRLGFSSSLYFERVTCGNFNFTNKV